MRTQTLENPAALVSHVTIRLRKSALPANIGWTLSGNLIYSASQWAMLVILARWTNAGTVGTFALALAITAPITIFFNMQLRAVIATDHAGAHTFIDYLRTRLLTSAAALTVTAICAASVRPKASTVCVILLVALSKAAESVTDIIHGHWQLLERMEAVGKSLVIRGILTLAMFASAVIIAQDLLVAVVTLLAGSVGVLLFYDCRRIRSSGVVRTILHSLKHASTPGSARSLVRRTFPLGVAATLISLNTAIPRYFIEAHRGSRELGIFAALSYFVVAGNMVISAIGQCVLPRLARLYTRIHWMEFRRTVATLIWAGMGLGVFTMLVSLTFSRQLLSIYGPDYVSASKIFLLLMAVGSLGYVLSIFNFTLNAIGSYTIQSLLFAAVSVLLVICCQIAVPRHGALGAAASLLIAGCFQAAASAVILLHDTRTVRRGQ